MIGHADILRQLVLLTGTQLGSSEGLPFTRRIWPGLQRLGSRFLAESIWSSSRPEVRAQCGSTIWRPKLAEDGRVDCDDYSEILISAANYSRSW